MRSFSYTIASWHIIIDPVWCGSHYVFGCSLPLLVDRRSLRAPSVTIADFSHVASSTSVPYVTPAEHSRPATLWPLAKKASGIEPDSLCFSSPGICTQ